MYGMTVTLDSVFSGYRLQPGIQFGIGLEML